MADGSNGLGAGRTAGTAPRRGAGARPPGPAPMAERHARRLARVSALIERDLAGDLSLDALADAAALSRFHFARVWKAATGETPWETVRRARLNRAAVRIAMTALPLARIARATGFADADAMARAYRAAFGLSPGRARALAHVPPALAAPGPATPNPRGFLPMPDLTIREAAPAELAALPHRGPYSRIGATFAALGRRLGEARVPPAGPAFGIYYDMPGVTPDEELRAHAGVEVAPGTPLPPDLERVRVPGGRIAVLLHQGAYHGIPGAWDAAYRALHARAEEEAGDSAPYERYLNDPDDTAEPDLLTEICIPLRPR